MMHIFTVQQSTITISLEISPPIQYIGQGWSKDQSGSLKKGFACKGIFPSPKYLLYRMSSYPPRSIHYSGKSFHLPGLKATSENGSRFAI